MSAVVLLDAETQRRQGSAALVEDGVDDALGLVAEKER